MKIQTNPKQNFYSMDMRREILNASIEAFSEKGYVATTIREIGKRVGLNSATLYYYFSSKEAILQSIVLQTLNDLVEIVEQIDVRTDLPTQAKLAELIGAYIKFLGNRRKDMVITQAELCRLSEEQHRQAVALYDRFEGILKRVISQGIQEGTFRPVEVAPTVKALIWSCLSIIYWYNDDGSLTFSEIVAYFTELWVSGLLHGNLPPLLVKSAQAD